MTEKHGNKWRVKLPRDINGKRGYKSFATEREAVEFEELQQFDGLERVTAKIVIDEFKGRNRQGPTVVEYGRNVIGSREVKRNTTASYESWLRQVEGQPLGHLGIRAVKPADIREFFATVKTSRRNLLTLLRMIFKSATKDGTRKDNPVEQADIKLRQAHAEHYDTSESVDTIYRIAEASPGRTHDLYSLCIKLAGLAGLRAGEVGGLRVEDIDDERPDGSCCLHLRRNAQVFTKREGELSSVQFDTLKGNESRDVFVDCELTQELRDYIDKYPPLEDGTILYTWQGNAVTNGVLKEAFRRAMNAAGVDARSTDGRVAAFHYLRHCCATNLAKGGFTSARLQKFMGWKSLSMAEHYTHLASDDLAGAAEIMSSQRSQALPVATKALATP